MENICCAVGRSRCGMRERCGVAMWKIDGMHEECAWWIRKIVAPEAIGSELEDILSVRSGSPVYVLRVLRVHLWPPTNVYLAKMQSFNCAEFTNQFTLRLFSPINHDNEPHLFGWSGQTNKLSIQGIIQYQDVLENFGQPPFSAF